MNKSHNNQSGFGVVELLLIVVIIGLIGFVGWYVHKAKQNTDQNLTVASSATQAKKKAASPTPTPAFAFVNVIQDDTSITQVTPDKIAKTSDEIGILNALRAGCTGQDTYVTVNHAVFDGTLNFRQDGTHAVINATGCSPVAKSVADLGGSGANNYLHKTSTGTWKVDAAGQTEVSCGKVDGLGYPTTILSDCLDGTTSRAPKQ